MSPARQGRRDDLLTLMAGKPKGCTIADMMAALPCTFRQANDAIHDLRAYLGDYDDMNLVCDPQGKGSQWNYRLVGRLDDMKDWTRNRLNDGETRLRTMNSMINSIVTGTSGRTTEGRRARLMEKSLRRLVEDLDDLRVNGPLP